MKKKMHLLIFISKHCRYSPSTQTVNTNNINAPVFKDIMEKIQLLMKL